MKRDVVGAIVDRVSYFDIADAIAFVEKRILRSLHRFQLSDGATLYRGFCLIDRAVHRREGRTADIDGPDQIGGDGRLFGRNRFPGVGLAAGKVKAGQHEQ